MLSGGDEMQKTVTSGFLPRLRRADRLDQVPQKVR